MSIEINRRAFLGILGATAAVAAIRTGDAFAAARAGAPVPPLHFVSDDPVEPPARPRTAAITYLSS